MLSWLPTHWLMPSLITTSGKMLAMGTITHLGTYTRSSCLWQLAGNCLKKAAVWGGGSVCHQAHAIQWDIALAAHSHSYSNRFNHLMLYGSAAAQAQWQGMREPTPIFRATTSHLNAVQHTLHHRLSANFFVKYFRLCSPYFFLS